MITENKTRLKVILECDYWCPYLLSVIKIIDAT